MIVANGSGDGKMRCLLLGLTAANIRELRNGRPILLKRETHGEGIPEDMTIAITYGQDEKALYDELKPLFAEDIVVNEEPRLKDKEG